mgnify:FL=1
MKRAFLFGLMAIGCALPGEECGMFKQENVVERDPGPGRCARVAMEDDAVIVRNPSDGCSADAAGQCLILMPGEPAPGFTPAEVGHVVGTTGGSRQEATLVGDACPLSCP